MQTNEIQNAVIHYVRSANGTITEVERQGPGVLSICPTLRQTAPPQACISPALISMVLGRLRPESECEQLAGPRGEEGGAACLGCRSW